MVAPIAGIQPARMHHHARSAPRSLLAIALLGIAAGALCGSESDDRIESTFLETYVYKTYLKDDSIRAESKDGVVTLTGTASDESHRGLAQETAAGLPGVTRVENRISARPANEDADAWIGRKVKLALIFHRNVNASKTDVSVSGGTVTLTGEAASDAQRDLTTAYARDVDGVTAVKNQTVLVRPAAGPERTLIEKIDDASLVAQIRIALRNQHSTHASQAQVQARDGEVTVTGIAANAAEKDLVGKLVTDLQGVTGVKNLMTISESGAK